MRQFLSVEMRYRCLERNPRKASTECFRCGSVAPFPASSPTWSILLHRTFHLPSALTHPASSIPSQNKPRQTSMLRVQPAQKCSAVPSCRRSCGNYCFQILIAPEAEFKEQDSLCCFCPASLRRPLELLFTIQLPALEGGHFYK